MNRRGFDAMVKRTPQILRDGATAAAKLLGLAIMSESQRTGLSGRPHLMNRTGALRRGFYNTVDQRPDGRELLVGVAGVKYARIQELGGKIVPKDGGWLTIPVGGQLTKAAGVSKGSAKLRTDLHFVGPFMGAKGPVAFLKDKAGKVVFILKKSVTIPARLGFYTVWRGWFTSRKAHDFLVKQLRLTIQRVMTGGSARGA